MIIEEPLLRGFRKLVIAFFPVKNTPKLINQQLKNGVKIVNLYILRGFKKLVIVFFPVKNTPKLINQQLKNGVKIVNWQNKVSYCFFYCQKYSYLKFKNVVKIVN